MNTSTDCLSDAQLPGLGLALSRDALLQLLSERLPECRMGLSFLDGRIADVQYVPGIRAHVLWKLRVHDPETGRTGRQLVSVRVMGHGEGTPAEPMELVTRYHALRARKDMARELPFRTPWLHIPQVQLLICAFPLDPALPTLMDVMDPHVIKDALHRAWRGRRARVRWVRADTLSYTPEARAALRFEVLAEDKDTGLPELRRLVGKLHVRRPPARLFAGHWAVWRTSMGRVAVAPPVGYVAAAQLSLQEFLTGTRLSDLVDRAVFPTLLRETARSLGTVHSLRLPLLGVHGVAKELTAVDRWVRILSRIRPASAGRLDAIGQRLRRELAARTRITGTIHADFHLANVLADGHGVTIIDWDQVAHGDPMVDVGRVLASLRVSSLRIHGKLDGFAHLEESFLQAYLAATQGDERRARLFEAVALLIAAAAPFRLQRAGWEEGAELMLEEVERTLELSLAGPRLAGTPPDMRHEVPFEERPRWALDPAYAQALLIPVVHETSGSNIEVTECVPKLLDGRSDRLHVRWVVKGYRGRERWRGSLEGIGFPDDSGRGRLRRLEVAGAVLERHPDALRLPRPVGHLDPLSMIVFVPPPGEALASLLDTSREVEALRRTADALARFHSLAIDLGKERETQRALRSLRRRVERLGQAGHLDAPSARAMLDRLELVLGAVGERRAPTVVGLHPRHLRIRGACVAASLLHDVLWAEPLMSVGDLLAQLAADAIERSQPPVAAERLRRAYADTSGCLEAELGAFAALALLSRACRRGLKKPTDRLVAPILSYAASLAR